MCIQFIRHNICILLSVFYYSWTGAHAIIVFVSLLKQSTPQLAWSRCTKNFAETEISTDYWAYLLKLHSVFSVYAQTECLTLSNLEELEKTSSGKLIANSKHEVTWFANRTKKDISAECIVYKTNYTYF